MTSEDSTIPNRQVKDLSFQPTAGPPRTQQSPTGRLRIFHSNLQQDLRGLNNPQPAGWGSFIPTYSRTSEDSTITNRQVGDLSFQPTAGPPQIQPQSPNRQNATNLSLPDPSRGLSGSL